MDMLTKEDRSALMSRIRSKGTGPEVALARLAARSGRRPRFNDPALPGKPDAAFHGARLAVFAHGCFWHGHECRGCRTPKANAAFWRSKLDANKRRDARDQRRLRAMGWRTLVLWECGLRRDPDAAERRLRRALAGRRSSSIRA